MDRIRQIWIESARSSSTIESAAAAGSAAVVGYNNNHHHHQHHHNSRPPPLRTSSTYDDDDAFNNVALNLLSRHEILGLSTMEAILATLTTSIQRASFYDGLCVRLDRSMHLSPNTTSLVYTVERVFGKELKDMAMEECKDHPCCYSTKPVSPRHTSTSMLFGGGNGGGAITCRNNNNNNNSGRCHNNNQHSAHKKKTTPRRFFPDGGGSSGGDYPHGKPATAPTIGFFGGSKRRVRNIDWKVAEAIQQVERLQLDCYDNGNTFGNPAEPTTYEPPRRM